MAAEGTAQGPPIEETKALARRWADWFRATPASNLRPGLIGIREAGIDPFEVAFAEGVRRLEQSAEYAADGALDIVAWVRGNCKLSSGAAIERVTVSRQLEQLPKTQQAFANGDLGYQHVAIMSRTAERVGAAAVQRAEPHLLEQAQSRDPGQFAGIAREFEHQTDAAAALAEANGAYKRRYVHLSEPANGLVRLDGVLDAEGGATLKTALDRLMPLPARDDRRTPGQRCADAIVDLARKALNGGKLGGTGGQRPHLVITASVETLAGVPGAPPARMDGVGPIPLETAQRHGCDATVSWLVGKAELKSETSHAHRQIPPSTRRALVARDRACVFNGCHRPASWCDGHHLVWWSHGGETKLDNLALVCGRHHRMLHEEGWQLKRGSNGKWTTLAPARGRPQSRSA